MKRIICFAGLAVILCSVSGCDMFRKLAGRPTSGDISAIREKMQEVDKVRETINFDSLRALRDSSALAADSLRVNEEDAVEPASAAKPAQASTAKPSQAPAAKTAQTPAAKPAQTQAVKPAAKPAQDSKADDGGIMTIQDVRNKGVGIYPQARVAGLDPASLSKKYYTVLGVFTEAANSDRLCGKIEKAGYTPIKVNLSSGKVVVAAQPSDSLAEAYDSFKKMSSEPFFTKGAWIMVNE